MSSQKKTKEQTAEKILTSACNLIGENHDEIVTMADIAKAAGISRQALYLHYPNRADLLVALARHADKIHNIDARLDASRRATVGVERLHLFIDAWGNYIPDVYCIASALFAMKDTDEAAEAAWNDRMNALRHGCEAAVKALQHDGVLSADRSVKEATDILWTMLSIQNWELLTRSCGWSQERYIHNLQQMTAQILTDKG